MNVFEHLELDLPDLRQSYDLGWLVLEATDGAPGRKGEPYIPLAVSFAMTSGELRREGHLDHALSRSFWEEQSPPTPTEADRESLRRLVLERLPEDLRAIDEGGDPEPLRVEGRKPKFLRP
jgi:hypothetical protein